MTNLTFNPAMITKAMQTFKKPLFYLLHILSVFLRLHIVQNLSISQSSHTAQILSFFLIAYKKFSVFAPIKTCLVLLLSTSLLTACNKMPTDDADLDDPNHQGMVYDVESWPKVESESMDLEDLEAIKSSLGSVVSTDQEALDFVGQDAMKYRFMKEHDPYLEVIDSEGYLEIGWYYANQNDSEAEKAMSLLHAQKAYQLMQRLFGGAGAKLVEKMLRGQSLQNYPINHYTIEVAKCEFYSCMVVIKKPQIQQIQVSDQTADRQSP